MSVKPLKVGQVFLQKKIANSKSKEINETIKNVPIGNGNLNMSKLLNEVIDKIDSIGTRNLYGENNMISPAGNLNLSPAPVEVDIKREIAIGKVDKNAVKSEEIKGKVNNKLDKLRALRKK
jgi:hypothetical protein